MNFRKFCTIFSAIALFFLTISGSILAVEYMMNDGSDASPNVSIEPTPTQERPASDKGPFNILLLGSESDKYTDIIMVVNYNPETNAVNVLSVPANTKADVKGVNGIRKIRSAYKEKGADDTADILTNMLGINFKYYIYFDYTALKNIVDAVDGIEYNLPVDLRSNVQFSGKDIDLKSGKRTFNGDMAVQLLSYKKPIDNKYSSELLDFYDGTEYSRAKLIQGFFKEFFRQKLNTEYIEKVEDIFKDNSKNIDTNIKPDDLVNLKGNAKNVNVQNVKTYMLTGTDQQNGDYYFEYSFNNRVRETDSTREFNISELFISPSFVSTKK